MGTDRRDRRRPGGSTWQSVATGRPVETHDLNGEIVRIGASGRRADTRDRVLVGAMDELVAAGAEPGTVHEATLLGRLASELTRPSTGSAKGRAEDHRRRRRGRAARRLDGHADRVDPVACRPGSGRGACRRRRGGTPLAGAAVSPATAHSS